MTTVYYTADLHLGHRLIAGLRGFGEDTDAHDAALATAWDGLVGKDDHVWVLGDLTMKGNPADALAWIVARPGVKHLVAGNHDPCHPMHRQAHKLQPRYLEAFASVQPYARRKIDGRVVLLSHFPFHADRGEVRYAQYRLPDLGEFLLHGHTHSRERFTSDHELHVGLDAWDLRPVSEAEVVDHLGLLSNGSVAEPA